MNAPNWDQLPRSCVLKNLPASAGDTGNAYWDLKRVIGIPGSKRSPGGWNGNPLQCSCLENSMDGGAWWAAAYGVVKGWIWLSNWALMQAGSGPLRKGLRDTGCFYFLLSPLGVCHCSEWWEDLWGAGDRYLPCLIPPNIWEKVGFPLNLG